MKKTLIINISGIVFHIDDDAFEKLKLYLNTISNHFSSQEEGQEIVNDIEARIAELFRERITNEQEVVTIEMVNQVVEIMGMPEDFEDATEEEPKASQAKNTSTFEKRSKRLYRDPDNRVFAGICAGLSHYMGIDKILMRIIFAILAIVSFGTMLLLYLILWLAIPKARTTAQRLEMKGQKITVENIGKSVKEEVNEMKQNFDKFKESKEFKDGNQYARQTAQHAKHYGKEAGSIFVKVLGGIFIFIGFATIISMILGSLTAVKFAGIMPGMIPEFPNEFFGQIYPEKIMSTLMVAALFVVGIPMLLLIYAGTKMIFNYVSDNRSILFSAIGIWVIGIILTIVIAAGSIEVFSADAEINHKEELALIADTIYIDLAEDNYEGVESSRIEFNGIRTIEIDDEEVLIAHPKFTVEKNDDDQVVLKMRKMAKGGTYRQAKRNAHSIKYSFDSSKKSLILDPYWILEDDVKWRSQKMHLSLEIPVGKTIYLDESLLPIIYDIENISDTWDGDMVNQYWIMTEEGLSNTN